MTNTLHVFIDESGSHTQGKCYSVAGCWCLSDRSDPGSVLSPTKNKLSEITDATLQDSNPVSELKGNSLPNHVIDSLLSSLISCAYEDKTIASPWPWTEDLPLRYSVKEVNPDVANHIVGDALGSRLDAPEMLQTIILTSVLNPMLHMEEIDSANIDNMKVILDAEIWQNPADRVLDALNSVGDVPENIGFEIKDSKATPGIQLADIAAYSWNNNILRGNCRNARQSVHSLRFSG